MKQFKLTKYVIPLLLGLFLLTACVPSYFDTDDFDSPAPDGSDEPDPQEENGAVSTYPFAPGMDRFTDMSVTVRDASGTTHDIELYSAVTNPKRQFPAVEEYFKNTAVAMFDMNGTVTVEITYPAGVDSAVVRPARAGIEHTVKNGNKVIFEITEWGQYTVEFNGDSETDALMIFANPVSVIPENARVITGRHDGDLTVGENQTVYLAPGSVVFGQVIMHDNSKLTGRGIITKSNPPRRSSS